jgi:hypothetical protein
MAGDKLATAAAADSALLREYELSDDDFQRIRHLVRERLGIALAESKRELVYGRLSRRLRALNCAISAATCSASNPTMPTSCSISATPSPPT